MLYNELIGEVTNRVEKLKSPSTRYELNFADKLGMWLTDFEHDILLSRGSKTCLTEEFMANAAFDKKLDETL